MFAVNDFPSSGRRRRPAPKAWSSNIEEDFALASPWSRAQASNSSFEQQRREAPSQDYHQQRHLEDDSDTLATPLAAGMERSHSPLPSSGPLGRSQDTQLLGGEMARLRKVITLQSQEITMLYAEVDSLKGSQRKLESELDGQTKCLEITRAQLVRSEDDLNRKETQVREVQREKDAVAAEGRKKLDEQEMRHLQACEGLNMELRRQSEEVRQARATAEGLKKQLEAVEAEKTAAVEKAQRQQAAFEAADSGRVSACIELGELRSRLEAFRGLEGKTEGLAGQLEENRARVRQLETDLSRLRMERDSFESKAALEQARVAKLEGERQAAMEQWERAKHDLMTARHEQEHTHAEMVKLRSQCAAAAIEIRRLGEEVEGLRRAEESLATARREAMGAEALLERSQVRCTELEEQRDELEEMLRRTRDEREDLERSREEAMTFQRGKAAAKDEVRMLRRTLEQVTQEKAEAVESVELKVTRHVSEVETLRRQLRGLEAAKGEAEEDRDGWMKQVQMLQDELAELRKKGRDYSTATGEILRELEKLKADGHAKDDEVDAKKLALLEAETALERAKATIRELGEGREELMRQLKAERKRCDGLERAVKDATLRVEEYEREVHQVRSETAATAAQLEALRRMLSKAAGTKDAVSDILKRTSDKLQQAVRTEHKQQRGGRDRRRSTSTRSTSPPSTTISSAMAQPPSPPPAPICVGPPLAASASLGLNSALSISHTTSHGDHDSFVELAERSPQRKSVSSDRRDAGGGGGRGTVRRAQTLPTQPQQDVVRPRASPRRFSEPVTLISGAPQRNRERDQRKEGPLAGLLKRCQALKMELDDVYDSTAAVPSSAPTAETRQPPHRKPSQQGGGRIGRQQSSASRYRSGSEVSESCSRASLRSRGRDAELSSDSRGGVERDEVNA